MANKIEVKSKRLRLAIRREPYWARLQAGGYLGFRRTENGGTWIARFRGEDKRQQYHALQLPEHLALNEYDVAVTAARAWFAQLEAGVNSEHAGVATVRSACQYYLSELETRKGPKAAKDARLKLEHNLLPILGDKRLDRLLTHEIGHWFNAFVRKDGTQDEIRRSKVTANRNLTVLKAVLNFAHGRGLVAATLAWSRVKPFGQVQGTRAALLSKQQLQDLVDVSEGAFRDLLVAAVWTGARYGELAQLRVRDLDQGARVLNIVHGKTGSRVVPLTSGALRHFKALTKDKLPDAFLLTRDNGEAWVHSSQDRPMREAVERAKLPKNVTFYSLRHAVITHMIAGGMDIFSVAKVCGTSVVQIERTYGKLLKDKVRGEMEKAAILSAG